MAGPTGKKRKRASNPRKAKKKTPAKGNEPATRGKPEAAETVPHTIRVVQIQTLAGATMLVFAFAGIVGLGAWLYGKTGDDTALWTGHALIRAAYAALIAFFLWNLIRRRRPISFILVLGCLVTAVFIYHGAEALRLNQEKIVANQVLGALRAGWRQIDELTPGEQENPYVDAYIVTRNMYWELNERADARMAEYSSSHERYTTAGWFLAPGRLRTKSDLWDSYVQLQELDRQLSRIGQTPLDTSDMLWSLDLLRVDSVTQDAYREDLRKILAEIKQAQEDSIVRERRVIARIVGSIEVLLDAEGRYRIEDERIIFDDPADAVRFSGKSGGVKQ